MGETMGVAAYQRGSAAISESIQRDFMNDRGGDSKRLREQMERAELRVQELEAFCLNAQSLYVDVTYLDSANGLLRGWMRDVWLKKCNTKRFQRMLSDCLVAHSEWVDSDHRNVFLHLQVCRKKAMAWLSVISFLNCNNAIYNFHIPSMH